MATESVKEGVFATKKDRQNLYTVGEAYKPVKTFTKKDFLNGAELAKKLSKNKELVKKTMKYIQFKGLKFIINGHRANVVTKTPTNELLLHPMAIPVFQEYLNKQKAK